MTERSPRGQGQFPRHGNRYCGAVRGKIAVAHFSFLIEPLQRKSDRIGSRRNGMNRPVQFCRDHFRAGARLRHAPKEGILFRRPTIAGIRHQTLLLAFSPQFYKPSADVIGAPDLSHSESASVN